VSQAAHLAARLYRRATSAIVQHEGFLEDALAAALEHPEVWPQLRRLAGWSELPEGPPESVATQERVPGGRTDVVLRWANGTGLVIELKAWDPLPDDGKLTHYGSTGHRVTVIAPHPTVYPAPFLPMLTWARLRALPWPDAPLIWEQLCNLIEAVGVAVPRLEMPAIMGLLPTWTAREVLEGWARPAVEAVQKLLSDAGWSCVVKGGARAERVENDNRRFGFWAWPEPRKDDEWLGVFCGIYLGDDGSRDVLVPGVPDLRLMVHVNPKHATSAALRSDPAFVAAAKTWARSSDGITRQYDPRSWYLLDARESLVVLAPAADQELAFRRWMEARAKELIDAGIVGRLAAVPR
jgi:hypothetical protein